MSVLDRDIWVRLFPIFPAVTGAFDEDGAGDRGHPHEIIDREHQLLARHAMDEQTVLRRI